MDDTQSPAAMSSVNSWKSPAAKTLGKEVDALKHIQAQLAEQTRAAAAFARNGDDAENALPEELGTYSPTNNPFSPRPERRSAHKGALRGKTFAPLSPTDPIRRPLGLIEGNAQSPQAPAVAPLSPPSSPALLVERPEEMVNGLLSALGDSPDDDALNGASETLANEMACDILTTPAPAPRGARVSEEGEIDPLVDPVTPFNPCGLALDADDDSDGEDGDGGDGVDAWGTATGLMDLISAPAMVIESPSGDVAEFTFRKEGEEEEEEEGAWEVAEVGAQTPPATPGMQPLVMVMEESTTPPAAAGMQAARMVMEAPATPPATPGMQAIVQAVELPQPAKGAVEVPTVAPVASPRPGPAAPTEGSAFHQFERPAAAAAPAPDTSGARGIAAALAVACVALVVSIAWRLMALSAPPPPALWMPVELAAGRVNAAAAPPPAALVAPGPAFPLILAAGAVAYAMGMRVVAPAAAAPAPAAAAPEAVPPAAPAVTFASGVTSPGRPPRASRPSLAAASAAAAASTPRTRASRPSAATPASEVPVTRAASTRKAPRSSVKKDAAPGAEGGGGQRTRSSRRKL